MMLDSTSAIAISNCTFVNNATDNYQFGDIYIGGLKGNLIINNIIIKSKDSESGIRISGTSSALPSPRPGLPAGIITLSNITIFGTQKSLGAYPSAALTLTRYSDGSNVTLTNIRLNSIAPNGLYLGTITSTPMDIGSVIFSGTFSENDLTLGRHGESGSYLYTDIAIDATNAIFVGATTDGEIEDRVRHSVDDGNLGTVSWTTP